MELHLALKNIIKTDGVSILYEPRLVNILCDFQAFDSIPASKYMLRAIIDDGYTKKLTQIGAWNHQAQSLCSQFSNITGFLPDVSWTIFTSIAFGLGWLTSLPPFQGPTSSLSHQNSRTSRTVIDESSSNEDIVAYLNSIVERKPHLEKQLGVEFSTISFEYRVAPDYFNYHCFVEVNGNPRQESICIKSSLVGFNGAILASNDGSIFHFKGYAVEKILLYFTHCSADKIQKIIVYPE